MQKELINTFVSLIKKMAKKEISALWEEVMDKDVLRYHLITCWVGAIFNSLFSLIN